LKIEPVERVDLQKTIDDLRNKTSKSCNISDISENYTCNVKIVCISDTHSKIPTADQLPSGDVLIHAGDLLAGWKTEIFRTDRIDHFKSVVKQLAELPFQHIILTPGNHDKLFDKNCYDFDQPSLNYIKNRFPKIKFLVNEELTVKLNLPSEPTSEPTSEATSEPTSEPTSQPTSEPTSHQPPQLLKIYASPTVCYRNSSRFTIEDQKPIYAHALERGSTEISENWKKIPSDVDILITHGPPLGIADLNKRGEHCGCGDLLHEVVERVKPRVHVFGHIHECAGQIFRNESTVFVNAGVLDQNYDVKEEEAVSFVFKK